jgi:hypothetical protein
MDFLSFLTLSAPSFLRKAVVNIATVPRLFSHMAKNLDAEIIVPLVTSRLKNVSI